MVELSDITTEEIEKGLKPLFKLGQRDLSKFCVRQKFIDVLDEKGIKLSKEEAIMIHTGDDSDIYSKRINQFMFNKGYTHPTHSYCKRQF